MINAVDQEIRTVLPVLLLRRLCLHGYVNVSGFVFETRRSLTEISRFTLLGSMLGSSTIRLKCDQYVCRFFLFTAPERIVIVKLYHMADRNLTVRPVFISLNVIFIFMQRIQ